MCKKKVGIWREGRGGEGRRGRGGEERGGEGGEERGGEGGEGRRGEERRGEEREGRGGEGGEVLSTAMGPWIVSTYHKAQVFPIQYGRDLLIETLNAFASVNLV